MRTVAVFAVASLVLGLGAVPAGAGQAPSVVESPTRAPSAVTEFRDAPLSGAYEAAGHVVTYTVEGPVEPSARQVQACKDRIYNPCSGVVNAGVPVRVWGEIAFTSATESRFDAEQYHQVVMLSHAETGAEREDRVDGPYVQGATYRKPFDITFTAPQKAAYDGTIGSGVLVTIGSSHDAFVGGDTVTQGVFVTLLIGVRYGTEDTQRPEIVIEPRSGVIPMEGFPVLLPFRVSDDSGRARWEIRLQTNGDGVKVFRSKGLEATGDKVLRLPANPGTGTSDGQGPYVLCGFAEDKTGKTSARAPRSSCIWLAIEVPMYKVTNGCGSDVWGTFVRRVLNWVGNTRRYGSTVVNVKPACDAHDAAYAGVAVLDPTDNVVRDFRTLSRRQADQKFRNDIMAICERTLTGTVDADKLDDCRAEAKIYLGLVRKHGRPGFDADAVEVGIQEQMPQSTRPPGGGRSPR